MTETRTRAQTTAPDPLTLLPVVLGLRAALALHGSVTIATADDLGGAGYMGLTTFDGQLIELADDLDPDEWRTTLVHELLHVLRGPCGHEHVTAEEEHIERLVDDVEQLVALAAVGGAA